ncbi:MAG TPA: sodium:alanine symporter family protein [Balneolaceae bacterium]|nr:sodium:alanine symporter family protein [Balneolaceae bacterium]
MSFFEHVVNTLNYYVWEFGIPGNWFGFNDSTTIPFVVIFLVGVGLFLSIKMAFVQIRRFAHGVAVTTGMYDDPDEPGDVSHFKALATTLSATIGIGNIAGVGIAIHWGGPGALFWMWVTAFLGMCTKFTEVTLALNYRDEFVHGKEKDQAQRQLLGSVSGGPMYYIEKGLGQNWKWMAILFAALLGTACFFTGDAIQANAVANLMHSDFGITRWITGLFTAGLVGAVILGGITRIGRVTGILTPLMAAIYVIGGLLVLIFHAGQIVPTLKLIFSEAFNPTAGVAGTGVGAILVTMVWGVKRGLFSNESGMGSAPIAHSAAQTEEPVSEGSVALLAPFIDTIVICTITGLAIIITGVWSDMYPTQIDLGSADASYVQIDSDTNAMNPVVEDDYKPVNIVEGKNANHTNTKSSIQLAWYNVAVGKLYVECEGLCDDKDDMHHLFTGTLYPERDIAISKNGEEYTTLYGLAVKNGANLTNAAFTQGLSSLGNWGGYIVTLAVLLFAISTAISVNYYGTRCAIYLFGEKSIIPYNVVFIIVNFLGAVTALTTVWAIGDTFFGLVIIPNLLALVLLSGKVRDMMKSYFKRKPWHDNYEKRKRLKEQKQKG